MLLTQVQLASVLLLLSFAPFLLYIAIARLATSPWLAWGLALTATLLAMGIRGHMQDLAVANSGRLERQQSPLLLQASPPFLLAISMALLAALVWGVGDCIGSNWSWCQRWTKLEGTGTSACSIRGLPTGICRVGSGGLQALGVAAVYLAGFLAWLTWWSRRESHKPGFSARLIRQLLVGSLSTAAMALLIYGLLQGGLTLWTHVRPEPIVIASPALTERELGPHMWGVLILGTPIMFLAFFVISLAQIGLAFYTDRDRVTRERWARLMGRTAMWVAFGICLPALLIALGPWLLHSAINYTMDLKQEGEGADWLIPLLSVGASAIGARAAYFDQTSRSAPKTRWMGRIRAAIIAVAPWAFVLGVLLLGALAAEWLLQNILGRAPMPDVELHTMEKPSVALTWLHQALFAPPWQAITLMLLAIAGIGLVFAKYIDENEFSMNGFYRNRIVRCYLGPTNPKREGDPETDLDPDGDDFSLKDILRDPRTQSSKKTAVRPLYPLISAAANLTATKDLDWQDRKAASFVFSPLFCGHIPLPGRQWRPIGDEPPRDTWHDDLFPAGLAASALAENTTLGTAVSISGAAVSPNMGYHSSPAVAILLTLFNARLGWWMENLNVEKGLLGFVGSKLLSELLSRSGDRARYTYVSDGGHFENLAIYELVRRRCRFIMSVDATADPDRDFESLGNAIHKCRVDLGAKIDIDISLMRPDANGISRRCAALGKIHYPDKTTGLLLYLKPSLLGNESADISHYASAHGEFPHEPTSDQFFDEHQFEAYRELGHASGRRVLMKTSGRMEGRVRARSTQKGGSAALGLEDHERKECLLLELEHCLFEPSNAISLRFTRHGAALSRLLEQQRRTRALRFLDDQINPGWLQVGGDPYPRANEASMALPEGKEFRACFYFVQQLIQLMESVYIDLDLERNWGHPDNRGWINLFRQWTWVPMFRLVWALSAQTWGSRFVRFCENQLDTPRISGALKLEWTGSACRGMQLQDLVKNLPVSFIEREILESPAITTRCDSAANWNVGILRIDWEKIFAETPPRSVGETNVGIVVALSDPAEERSRTDAPLTHLAVLRVQDHLRRIGIGAELAYLTVEEPHHSIEFADVRDGDYGTSIGPMSKLVARRQNRELQEILTRARRRRGLPTRSRPPGA
jgi:hypothetical protein